MSERYAFTHEEFAEALHCFRLTPRLTVKALVEMTGVNEGRCRAMLETLGEAHTLKVVWGGTRKEYTLAPDHRQRIAERQRRQEARAAEKGGKPTTASRMAHILTAQTWPSGDPTHFDTDWLGRVIYRGPVPAKDARFEVCRTDDRDC